MKNTNEKPVWQLPVLFTLSNRENGISNDGVVNILLKWDAGINNKISTAYTERDDMNKNIQDSEQEHQYFRTLLLEEMISRESTLDKQQLIETVSIYFIRVMDSVFKCARNKDLARQVKTVFEEICQHFQKTFQFMEEFFGGYINKELKAPAAYIEIVKAELFKKLQIAKSGNINSAEGNNSLINIVVAAITEKLSGSSVISISSITYISQLADEIYRQSKPLPEQNLRDILFNMNFNEDNFVEYEYARLLQVTDNLTGSKEKISVLRFEQKIINQLPVKVNVAYTCFMPSLKEQINGWIEEEIKFLEKSHLLIKIENTVNENEDKIHTSLSVAKLALLVRLLVIDKIIINRTAAPMLRVVTKVFTSLQRETISFGSFETKFHAPDKATINAVREILFKWINILAKL
jgi:hypothetical protein